MRLQRISWRCANCRWQPSPDYGYRALTNSNHSLLDKHRLPPTCKSSELTKHAIHTIDTNSHNWIVIQFVGDAPCRLSGQYLLIALYSFDRQVGQRNGEGNSGRRVGLEILLARRRRIRNGCLHPNLVVWIWNIYFVIFVSVCSVMYPGCGVWGFEIKLVFEIQL